MNTLLKILLIFIGVIVVIVVGAALFFASYASLNTKELQSNEVILKGDGNKKALVLYQKSKHSTATDITMALAKALNENGYTVVINHPSSKLTYHTKDFDVLAFGSAVYMGTVSKPLQSYMEKTSFEGKKVMIYVVGSSTETNTEVDLLKGKAKGADFVDGIKVKKGQEYKIKAFVKGFLEK